VALLVFAFGALFGALFALNNLIRTLARAQKVTFFDLLLAFLTAITLLTALLLNNTAETPDPYIEWVTLLACGALAVFSLLIILLEVFRPQRLRGSRGILGLFSALLIAIASFVIPFAAAYFALDPETNREVTDARATTAPVTNVSASDLTPDGTPTISPEDQAQLVSLVQGIRRIVAEEIDVPEVEVFQQLDAGKPLAEIIEENGGDVENVVRELTAIMRESLETAVARGSINRLQAALLSSQMGTFIRIAISNDLNNLGQQLGGATPDPQATRASLMVLLTQLPPYDATQQAPETAASATPVPTESEPTSTPRPTEPPTATPSPTTARTPRPTLTPIPTLTPLFAATTPPTEAAQTGEATSEGMTAAPPTPRPAEVCLASVNYNLRLRTEPSRDADTILVIPYATTIDLFGRNSDSTWWFTAYEGQEGWVDGEFLTLSASCANLPAR
jgi:hypothetical protein